MHECYPQTHKQSLWSPKKVLTQKSLVWPCWTHNYTHTPVVHLGVWPSLKAALILIFFSFFFFNKKVFKSLTKVTGSRPELTSVKLLLCLCVWNADLAELPLVKFDFSCNKISTIPVCFRKMKQLQSLQLENNPLQSPPAQVRAHTQHFDTFSSYYLFCSFLCARCKFSSMLFKRIEYYWIYYNAIQNVKKDLDHSWANFFNGGPHLGLPTIP